MSQICNDNIKWPKPQDILLRILKIYAFYQKIQQRTLAPTESSWSYIVSAFENITKNLVVQGRVQLEHGTHIVKVSVKATF